MSPVRTQDLLTISGYRIHERLCEGGMSDVFLATQESLGRLVAIKVLRPSPSDDALGWSDRFRQEAESLARLAHPNILPVFDFGETDGRFYLVMEYLSGGDLRRLMAPGAPLPTSTVREIILPLCRALDCLHQAGILHRDLKPENILLASGNLPKIADLGIARIAGRVGSLTAAGEILGTEGYVAPEQRYGLPVSEASDQYSLASIAYEMLTGRRALGVCPPCSSLNRALDRRVDRVLARGLQSDPDDRFPKIEAFARALDDALSPPPSASRRALLRGIALGAAGTSLGTLSWLHLSPVRPAPPSSLSSSIAASLQTPAPTPRQMIEPWRNRLGMSFLLVPSGDFWMGAPDDDPDASPDERPRHRVRITQPFYLGVHEVTVAQFRRFVNATKYQTVAETDGRGGGIWDSNSRKVIHRVAFNWRNPRPNHVARDQEPVTQITPTDAIAFCKWLASLDGFPYRLPTEAQWEYACRAGTETKWTFGNDPDLLAQHAWFAGNADKQIQPVGLLEPNPWGFHDMAGNAWEFCSDLYAPYDDQPQVDPQGGLHGNRWVRRGGSWDTADSLASTRSSARSFKSSPYFTCGFRVCFDAAVPNSPNRAGHLAESSLAH